MEWLLLALLAPLVLVPVVLMCGFAGCGETLALSGVDPLPPTSLSAERVGDRKIKLKWAHSNAAATFRISRGESSGTPSPVPVLQDITGTEVEDDNLPEGTTFFYSIAAVEAGVASSSFSSQESNATTLPADPSDVVAVPALNSVTLTWKNNSAKAKQFTIEKSGTKVETALAPGAPLTHTDSGLTSGTTSEYILRAFVSGTNKGQPERVESAGVKTSVTTQAFKPVYPPSTGTPVPLTTDQSVPGFCFVQRIGADRLENSGTLVRVTIRGALTGSLTLTAITISHAVATGEAWDSASPMATLGTNVVVPAGTPVVLPPAAFALDKTKALLIAFDVSPTPGQGNARYGPLVDAQTKAYFKAATQEALVADRASDFLPSNNVYVVEKIEVA